MAHDDFTLELESSDGVAIEYDKETKHVYISFPSYLLNAPRKPVSERETEKDSGIYTVPKVATFVFATKRFKGSLDPDYATGFNVSLQVNRKLTLAKRREIYDAAKAKGLKLDAKLADEMDGTLPTTSDGAAPTKAGRTRLA